MERQLDIRQTLKIKHPAIAGPAYPKAGGKAAKEVVSDVGPLAVQSVERRGSWGNRLADRTIYIGIIHR
jgi:hypothetical protein